ncbi:MAG: hypothetical protein ACYC91_02665 [Solirubrobacteraceae bacterium]
MSDLPEPLAESVVATYLGNYLTRAERSPDGAYFPSREPSGLAQLFLARLSARITSSVATAVLAREHERSLARLVSLETIDSSYNLCLVAALVARGGIAERKRTELVRRGAEPGALGSVAAMCWRLLAVALASGEDSARDEIRELCERLSRWAARQVDRLGAGDLDPKVAARVAISTGWTAQLTSEDSLASTALELSGLLGAVRRETTAVPMPSSLLAQMLLAATFAKDSHLCALLLDDLGARIDAERHLLRQELGSDKYDFSPWIPLALEPFLVSTLAAEDVLDPRVSPLPSFAITGVRGDQNLVIGITDKERAFERTIRPEDFNLLLDRILQTFAHKDTSPRQHGHMVIALDELVDSVEPAPVTSRVIDSLLDRGLTVIESQQQANGGWNYSHRGVPSTVYSAGKRTTTEFPDYQYTIDAAVPGVALIKAYMRSGDSKYLDIAHRALAFLEHCVGRVSGGAGQVWRLYPEDAKTERMGTAVNYELWVGYFFAWLLQVETDKAIRSRLEGYLDDIVGYAAIHLEPNGDIAYGDYVDEKRTAYASWDAFLLYEIGQCAGIGLAGEMADRIVARLAELILPCGIVPNVSDYFETVGGFRRWLVHRHGIGPYPVRTYYQLYFAVAGSKSEGSRGQAARALAYTLTDLYEPTTGGLNPGYMGRGELDPRAGVSARDWAILSLAALPRMTGMRYRADHTAVDSPRVRIDRMLTTIHTGLESGPPPGSSLNLQALEASQWLRMATGSGVEMADFAGASAQRVDSSTRLSLLGALCGGHEDIEWIGSGALPQDLPSTDPAAAACLYLLLARSDSNHCEGWLGRLAGAQTEGGLFSARDFTEADATTQVICLLLEARSVFHDKRSIDLLIRPAVKSLWKSLCDPAGRIYVDSRHAAKAEVDAQAFGAYAFRRASIDLRWERMNEVADRATAQLFLSHRTARGAPGSRATIAEVRFLQDARAFWALMQQREALVDWLQREESRVPELIYGSSALTEKPYRSVTRGRS